MNARFSSWRVVLPLCLVALGLCPRRAESQPLPRSFDVTFSQLASEQGGFDYELSIRTSSAGRPSSFVEWTAPDGQTATGYRPSFEDGDFTTLGDSVFGAWQLDVQAFADRPAEEFTFELVPFSLDSVYTERSTIISPLDGSSPPLNFNLVWNYAGDPPNTGRAVTTRTDGVRIEGNFAASGEPLYHATANFDGGRTSGEATIRAGSFNRDPTQVIADDFFLEHYSPAVVFRNLSAPAFYTFHTPVFTPGDTNGDGHVDIADLNEVRNHFGAMGSDDGTLPGDAFPFDGVVDVVDLNAVRNNFGAGPGAVPEPSAVALSILGAVMVLVASRPRRMWRV